MAGCGQCLGLTLKSVRALGIPADAGGQHLDGDLATELDVAGVIHLAHPAFAQLGGDSVMRE